MMVGKVGLRVAFAFLVSLNFSNAWSATATGLATGLGMMTMATAPSAAPSAATSGAAANLAPAQVGAPSIDAAGNADVHSVAKDTVLLKAPDQAAKKKEPQPKSEFQDFVERSVGHELPMYGYELFRNSPDTFAPLDHVPVTPDYTIGPGDELLVRIWGQVEFNHNAVVDRDGMINLPGVGPVGVVGVRYQDLQSHLKAAIGRVYKNFELDVSLGKLRSMRVFVVGQAAKPGDYTVSSLSTLVTALFASGGPSEKGSMRHIQLRRGDRLVTEFDMYDLLLKGDKTKDVQLLPGDVIYIPAVGQMVAIAGSVNTQAVFELKGGESLADLIELAGGLTSVAAGQRVSVERIFEHETRKVDEIQMDKAGLSTAMHDGDLVKVYSISSRFDNAVTLRGNIAIPGRHPWKAGMRVSDIIPDKAVLITENYWQKQNKPIGGDHAGTEKIRNDVKHSLSEVNWDYAVIERLDSKSLTNSLIPFNLGKAVVDRDPAQDMLLMPGDVITIFSKDDIQVPVSKRTKYVTLEGELANPGIYQVQPGETLRQLVARVGGITPQANLFSSEFTRESTRQMQQKRMDEMVDRMEQSVQRNAGKISMSALSAQDVESAKAQALSQQALIGKMRNVKATGRIVMELPEKNAQVKDLPDIALEDGDRFYVPEPSSTISVIGMVYNQNAFVYKSALGIDDYLGRAGGPTRDADVDEIYLVHADGTVISKRQGGSIFSGFSRNEVLPGDTIVVGEQLEKFNLTKDLMNWTQIFYQFALAAAGGKAAKMW